jgi:hypothetical protein
VEKNGSWGHVSYVGPGMSSGSRRHLINNVFIALAGRAAEEVGLQKTAGPCQGHVINLVSLRLQLYV